MEKTIVNKVVKMMKKNEKYTHEDLENAIIKADNIIKCIQNGEHVQLFKYGNLKLQSNIAAFALPEKITCIGACKGCYASKRLFPNVKVSRLANLLLIEYVLSCKKEESKGYFLSKFYAAVREELELHYDKCEKKKQKAIFRWHDSGDIFSINYLLLMINIAIRNPQINFYTYTKSINILRELHTTYSLPENFNIVQSYVYTHVNYFDLFGNFDEEFVALSNTFAQLRYYNEKAFICNYNLDKFKEKQPKNYNKLIKLFKEFKDVVAYSSKHLECGVCDACCKYKYTLFIKH